MICSGHYVKSFEIELPKKQHNLLKSPKYQSHFVPLHAGNTTKYCPLSPPSYLPNEFENKSFYCAILSVNNLQYTQWYPLPCNKGVRSHVICTNASRVKLDKNRIMNYTSSYLINTKEQCKQEFLLHKHDCIQVGSFVVGAADQLQVRYTMKLDNLLIYLGRICHISLKFAFWSTSNDAITWQFDRLAGVPGIKSLKPDVKVGLYYIKQMDKHTGTTTDHRLDLQVVQYNCTSFVSILSLFHKEESYDTDLTKCWPQKLSSFIKEVLSHAHHNSCSTDLLWKSNKGECLPFVLQQECTQYCHVTGLNNTKEYPSFADGDESVTTGGQFFTDCFKHELNQTMENTFAANFRCPQKNNIPCVFGCQRCFPMYKLCVYELATSGKLMHCASGSHLQYCEQMECNNMFKCYNSYCVPYRYVLI